jgi:hypothetical protein
MRTKNQRFLESNFGWFIPGGAVKLICNTFPTNAGDAIAMGPPVLSNSLSWFVRFPSSVSTKHPDPSQHTSNGYRINFNFIRSSALNIKDDAIVAGAKS